MTDTGFRGFQQLYWADFMNEDVS